MNHLCGIVHVLALNEIMQNRCVYSSIFHHQAEQVSFLYSGVIY